MRAVIAVIFASLGLTGCTMMKAADQFESVTVPAAFQQGVTEPHVVPELEAFCGPPKGWIAQPLERDSKHTQQVWVSPSGRTAFGVIRFTLPIPATDKIALWGFLQEMKRREGQAKLVSRKPLPDGTAFVADGAKFRIRGTIVTRGLRGWVAYAGTLQHEPVEVDELELAVQARDNTAPGLPDHDSPATAP
jgi:hypothetical protein